jgi:hypothetical protein
MSQRKCGTIALLALVLSAAVIQPALVGTPVPREEYVFVRDTDRVVAIKRGGDLLIGKLDADGNFLQEKVRPGAGLGPSSWPPPIINMTFLGPEPVYEYRSGRLIKGELNADGNVVPEVGSKVIRFEDYRYSTGVRIWNLPGYFKMKDKVGDKKDDKK